MCWLEAGYKCSDEDPRIMVPREIDDYDASETYYRLLPEGVFEDYDGETQNGRPNNFDLCVKILEVVFC